MHQGRTDRNEVIMANKFRLILSVAGIVIAPLFFSGCFKGESVGIPASGSTAAESDAIQKSRSAIVMDFITNEISATEKYKAEWRRLQGAYEPVNRTGIAYKLAISGQLIGEDPENYSDYYSYILKHMPAEDWELREIALGGLRMQKDQNQ